MTDLWSFLLQTLTASGAAALLLRRVRDFAKRGAACILLCGILFAFVYRCVYININ